MRDKTLKPKGPEVGKIFDFLGELTFFVAEKDDEYPAITLQVAPNKTKPSLAVIVGENANGKSFVRRVVKEAYQRLDMECIALSVQGRRQVAYNPMLVFVYGDEDTRSTGDNSVGTILGAMKTSAGREKPHAIFWDEPDLGLSEGWAACAGREIAAFLKKKPELLQGVFLVTHSRPMLRELRHLNPLFVYVGEDRQFNSLDEWLDAPIPTYGKLGDLQAAGLARFRKLSRMLKG